MTLSSNLAYPKRETRDPGHLVEPKTRDPRPGIHLIGEIRYTRPGTGYPSHELEPRPVTIKVGLNILSMYGTQDSRTGILNMNDSYALCVYVYFVCLSCILRQEHF